MKAARLSERHSSWISTLAHTGQHSSVNLNVSGFQFPVLVAIYHHFNGTNDAMFADYTSTLSICLGLNENGPHRPLGNGSIRRCGRAGGTVSLLEGVCHWGWALKFQKIKPDPVAQHLFLLLLNADVELSAASPALILPSCCHASDHDIIGLNL